MNCLEKYRGKLIGEINRNLGVILVTPEEDSVHNFRVGIKRLTALYYFLHEIDPDLNAKQLLRPYRVPFKMLGNIRDAHIAVHVIDSLEDIKPQDSKPLISGLKSKARQDYRIFQKSLPADKQLSIRMPTIKSTGISMPEINRQKPVILNRLLSKILTTAARMDTRPWHRKRILLKRYHHVLDVFYYCPGHSFHEAELKQLKILEQLLGDWHDRVTTAELIRSLPDTKTGTPSALAIIEQQDKLLLGASKIYLRKFALWHQKI